LLLLSACSTGSLGLRFLYSRFDNTLNQRILSYAEFDKAQKAEIRRAVDAYVAWHRRYELPRYADFIDTLQQELETGTFSEDSVLRNLAQLREIYQHGFVNSPLVTAPDFLRRLSDAQVEQVGEAFVRREKQFRERRRERGDTGSDDVMKGIVRNVKRLGVALNEDQRAIIARGLKRYRWQPGERRRQWRRWEREFLALLKRRRDPGFSEQVRDHLAEYNSVGRDANPSGDDWNQRNSARIIHEVLRSLDARQRRALVKRLGNTRRTLLAMAGARST
jgi:hypothetical protein